MAWRHYRAFFSSVLVLGKSCIDFFSRGTQSYFLLCTSSSSLETLWPCWQGTCLPLQGPCALVRDAGLSDSTEFAFPCRLCHSRAMCADPSAKKCLVMDADDEAVLNLIAECEWDLSNPPGSTGSSLREQETDLHSSQGRLLLHHKGPGGPACAGGLVISGSPAQSCASRKLTFMYRILVKSLNL